MKIKRVIEGNALFDDIPQGDVFDYEGGFYMKLATNNPTPYNAVRVVNGTLAVFTIRTLVTYYPEATIKLGYAG